MLKNKDFGDFKTRMIFIALAFCIVLTLPAMLDSPARANANQNQTANPAAGSADDPLITLSYLNGAVSYTVVEMKKGQSLRAKSNSLEIILRPGGEASVVSRLADLGLADLTAGAELLNGNKMPVNHAVLIPRADGRGISITSDIAYVMVRGDYEIY